MGNFNALTWSTPFPTVHTHGHVSPSISPAHPTLGSASSRLLIPAADPRQISSPSNSDLLTSLPLTMTCRSAPKHPITPSLLHVICRVCDHIPRVGRVLKAAYLLDFFAFLRRSNLAPNSSTTFDPTTHMRRGDVIFQEPGAVITLRWSKTMQDGTRSHEIPIPSIPNHPLDPVAAIKDMYRQIPTRTSDDPFLMLPDRSPVTTRLLATALHSILRESGFPANNYSLHSLRRGGATAAFRAGAEVHDIQRHGIWRSSCVWAYIAACGASDSPIATRLERLYARHSAAL